MGRLTTLIEPDQASPTLTISRGSAAYTEGGEAVAESLPECAKSFEELSKAVKAALETWKWGPLTIFLDSVDQ